VTWRSGGICVCAAILSGCGPAPDVLPGIDAAPPAPRHAVVINELMAANVLTAENDWVELYNPGDLDVPLDGWALTDDEATPRKQRLDGRVLPAGGYLMVVLSFGLPREGGAISLVDSDGAWVDRLRYGEQAVDLSAARVPDGSGTWSIRWLVTPGEPNGDGDPGDPAGDPEDVPAAGDVSERLLGSDAFPSLELEIPPESEDSLRAMPRVWAPATIVYEGRPYGPVGVRLKGNNSFRPYDEKPSFKVKIDLYTMHAELLGLDDLTLNNMHNDPSMLADPLSYWVVRAAGVPASRATHAQVRVNGMSYGLYALVETVEPRFLRRWFATDDGPLFEGNEVDFVAEQIALFEHEGGPDDRAALSGLAEALSLPPDQALAAAEAWVDLASFRRYWAALAVVGQFDGFPYAFDDYHVYDDPTTGKLAFLPWGMDETYYRWWRDPDNVVGRLAIACEHVPSCRDAFIAEVWDVVDLTEELDLVGRVDTLIARTEEAALDDRRKAYTDDQVAEGRAGVYEFVARRRSDLEQQFLTPWQPPPDP
jgi:hypothetical protein